MKAQQTSAIMLHTVGREFPQWIWRHLTVSWQWFEKTLQQYKRMGYRSVSIDEYRDIFLSGALSRERVVCFTFDDGYLDNWVYASVLLEEYGFTGTVFVSGDFIDPGGSLRPRWRKHSGEMPEAEGFLNRAELRELDGSGILDVQSHGVTHTWYPCGSRIVDFRHPGDSYHWMDWNAEPESKWKQIQPCDDIRQFGLPVYEHAKSMDGPRFYPNPSIDEELRLFVKEQGEGFFQQPGWREVLFARVEQLRADLPIESWGQYEEEDAFMERVRSELADSSQALEGVLNKKPKYLCWPGGGYSDEVFSLAAEYYEGTTISGSRDQSRPQGLDERGCFRFARFGPLHTWRNGNIHYLGPLTTCLYTEERRTGSLPCRIVRGGLTRLAQWGLL